MPINLGQAIANAENVDAELVSQQMELMNTIGTEMAAINADKKAIAMGGQLVSPEMVRLQNVERLQTEARKRGLAAAAGFNSDLSADIQAILLNDLRENALKTRVTAAKLEKDKSVSLFEDPGLAILNAFTIPWDEQELQGLSSQREQLNSSLHNITAGVTNAAAAAHAIEAKITEASALEEQNLIAGELERQKKLGNIEVLKHNLDGVKLAMESKGRTFQRLVAYDEWQNREENRAFLRMQRQEAIEISREKDKQIADERAARQRMMELANLALAEAEKPQFRTPEELFSKLLTAKDKQLLESLVDKGRILEDQTLRHTYRHGETVQETVAHWDSVGFNPQATDKKTLVGIVRQAAADAAAAQKEGRAVAAEKLVQDKITELEYVKKDDGTNPLRAITFGTMLNQAEVQSQRAFPILKEMVTEGNAELSAHPSIVFPVLANAVIEKKISHDDAARLMNAMYKASATVVNADTKLSALTGMKQTRFIADIEGMPAGFAANIGAEIPGIATGLQGAIAGTVLARVGLTEAKQQGKKIDFTNFNQVRNLLVNYEAAKVGHKFNIESKRPGGETGIYGAPLIIRGNE